MHKAFDLALRETETKYLFITEKIEIDGEPPLSPYRFKEDPLPENGLYSVALESAICRSVGLHPYFFHHS
jgi:hypothetical protein